MMKRKLFGISATLAVLLAFGLVLASCGDDDGGGGGGGGKTVTFTLAKIGEDDKVFTLAVSGAHWTKTDGTLLTEDMNSEFGTTANYMIDWDNLQENGGYASLAWTFNLAAQTLTATANDELTGPVTFKDATNGFFVTDGGDALYVAAGGITFGE